MATRNTYTMVGTPSNEIESISRLMESLRRSEEQYRVLVDTVPAVTWLADERDRMLFVSPYVETLLGITPEEIKTRGWFSLVHPDDLDALRARRRALMARKRPPDLEYRVRHKDGRWIWVNSRSMGTYEREGVLYLSGVLMDVTDRKEAETIRQLIVRQVVNVQEAERAKLSRELHDGTAQMLAALLLGFRRLKQEASMADEHPQIERLQAMAQRALAEVRRMSRGLRPRVLDDLGLVPALEQHAAEYGEMHGITVDVDAAQFAGGRLPTEIESGFYRIMQEALSNVARHSGASKARVTVERNGALLRMTVADDGCGFDVATVLRTRVGAAGFGLHSIRERAAVLRGMAMFDSTPGQGTTIIVEIPLLREAS